MHSFMFTMAPKSNFNLSIYEILLFLHYILWRNFKITFKCKSNYIRDLIKF